MRILITGSSGYVGNVLAEHFTELGYEVVGCDLRPMDRQKNYRHFTFRGLDVADAHAVRRAFDESRPDRVIHLAYLMDPHRDPKTEERIDVQGSMNVFAAADGTPSVKQLLLFSSTSAYGANPMNKLWIAEQEPLRPNDYPYAIHKKTVEERYRAANKRTGLHLVVVRMCTAVGPRYFKSGGVVASFSKAPFALMVDGQDMNVQWIHETDVEALVTNIIQDEHVEDTFNLVPDTFTSVSQMAEALHKPVLRISGRLLRAIIGFLWFARLSSVSPPMVRLMTNGIVASPAKIKQRYGHVFRYDSLGAFLDAVKTRKQNGTL